MAGLLERIKVHTINRPEEVRLGWFYFSVLVSMFTGVLFVDLLNLVTPARFFDRLLDTWAAKSSSEFILGWLFWAGLLAIILALAAIVLKVIMAPLRTALDRMIAGVESEVSIEVRRRALNLPFVLGGVNFAAWLVIPLTAFSVFYLNDQLDTRAAFILAFRSTLAGLISSSVSFFMSEHFARKHLFPIFFPRGGLARVEGAIRIPIARRIRLLYASGTLIPMIILISTLIVLQGELDFKEITAREYGRDILIFAATLGGIFFVASLRLNFVVSRSIVLPLENILWATEQVRRGNFEARIRVVSNDEIGDLADAGNAMIAALAEQDRLRSEFGRYITPQIRDEILSGRIPLNGERREATVLFADLRNFTAFVENHRSEKVIAGMRAYFTAMHRAIRAHGGLVLQFVGDEIEAVFGVPVPFEDHAHQALQAALRMRRALDALNLHRDSRGQPTFSHGIGLHSGTVLAGNSGSEEQHAYSLIGSTVNVASRIQELTKELEHDILASRETIERLGPDRGSFRIEPQAPRLVKGYSKPVEVFKIFK